MLLRRTGNKSKIANKIIEYFPPHELYIELFFGAGGMFFNKPRAKYNILNDLDSEIYNLFTVLRYKKDELAKYCEMIPHHTDFWNECNGREPENDIEKAVYFLVKSNFSYLGSGRTMRIDCYNAKSILLKNIEKPYLELVNNGMVFMNFDFRKVIKSISFTQQLSDRDKSFIYSDPPYFQTKKYLKTWTEQDVIDCFDVTFNSGIRAAMSEFDNPFILEQAAARGLNVMPICERQTIKNRNTEILITNYDYKTSLFPDIMP